MTVRTAGDQNGEIIFVVLRPLVNPAPIEKGPSIKYVCTSVSEIKVLFDAPTGCTSHITAHTGCTPPKIVHPAVKMSFFSFLKCIIIFFKLYFLFSEFLLISSSNFVSEQAGSFCCTNERGLRWVAGRRLARPRVCRHLRCQRLSTH